MSKDGLAARTVCIVATDIGPRHVSEAGGHSAEESWTLNVFVAFVVCQPILKRPPAPSHSNNNDITTMILIMIICNVVNSTSNITNMAILINFCPDYYGYSAYSCNFIC